MESYTVTLHLNTGDPAVKYYPTADSSAKALLAAAQYACKRGLDVKTVEVEAD